MESNTNFDSLVPEHAKVTEPAQHEAVDHPHHDDEVHSISYIDCFDKNQSCAD